MFAGDNRLASYFVVVGLGDNPTPYKEVSDDAVKQKYKLKPITDVVVINRDEGEEPPPGYLVIEKTPSGLDADLNHGSLRAPRMHICYKRGIHKPPLTEIGVIFEGKEQLIEGCTMIEHTPYGRSANVNNSSRDRTFLVFRRAATLSASELYAVTEIEVLNKSRGERAPHLFLEIDKPLNRSLIGSEMMLCYRKTPVRWNTIAYRPAVVSRYPLSDYADVPLPPSVALFCLPLGCTIESWPCNYTAPASPAFSTFVLTSDVKSQLYGASIDFYEPFDAKRLNDEQLLHLGLRSADQHQHGSQRQQVQCESSMHTVCRKSICLLSAFPCFDAFREFLRFLHKLVTSKATNRPALRIERYVTFFINNVLLPRAAKRRILLQLSSADWLRIELPFERPIEAGGASFRRLLMNLGAENCVELFTLVLLEQKLLIHSLMRNEVTPVCEAVRSMTFPCAWQCVYVPLCPPGIAHEITAGSSFDDFLGMPNPFIVGVDSRSFDYFTPPDDVICVDMDTRAILRTGEKRTLTAAKLLPKRALKQLRCSLDELFQQLLVDDERQRSAVPRRAASVDPLAIDEDLSRRKRKEFGVELLIQQAFVRCMCTLFRGYKQFFKPIVCAPTLDTARDLFDSDAFVKSRDKADARFYQLLTRTQMFTRFVEECSFTSDPKFRSALAFFDECAARADSLEAASSSSSASASASAVAMKMLGTPTLATPGASDRNRDSLRRDSVAGDGGVYLSLFALDLRVNPSETTVFLSVPETDAEIGGNSPASEPSNQVQVHVVTFPPLDLSELRAAERRAPQSRSAISNPSASDGLDADARLLVIRDKQELRHSQRHAEEAFSVVRLRTSNEADTETDVDAERDQCKARVKCVLYHSYAMWFVHLPAYVSLTHQSAARRRVLTLAYDTLFALHERNRFIVADQVCHRVLMLLCGRYLEPRLAVRTLERMRRHVEPNAITYACYNRTLFECRWDVESQAAAYWRRLRHVLAAASRFRSALKTKSKRPAAAAKTARNDRSTLQAPNSEALKPRRNRGGRNVDHRRSASIASALLIAPHTLAASEAETASIGAGSLELLPHRVAAATDVAATLSSINCNLGNAACSHVTTATESASSISPLTQTKTAVSSSVASNGNPQRFSGRFNTLAAPKCVRSPGHYVKDSRILQDCRDYRTAGCRSHALLLQETSTAGILMTMTGTSSRSRAVAVADAVVRKTTTGADIPERNDGSISLSNDSASGSQQVDPSDCNSSSDLRLLLEKSSGVSIDRSAAGPVIDAAAYDQPDDAGSSKHSAYANKPFPSLLTQTERPADADALIKQQKSGTASRAAKNTDTARISQPPVSNASSQGQCHSLAADSGYVDDANIQHFVDTASDRRHDSPAAVTASGTEDRPKLQSQSQPQSVSQTTALGDNSIVLVEVDICSVTRCDTCQLLLYDEEIMSGWSPDDSEFRTRCQFCEMSTVPRLHVSIRDRRTLVTDLLRSSASKLPAEQTGASTGVGSARHVEPISVPFLSSLVLRKELETVVASESELSLARPSFADKHPVLFWNLVYLLKRLHLPTHLPGFILFSRILACGCTSTSGGPQAERDRPSASESVEIEPRLLYDAAQYVHVRLLWDNPHALQVAEEYRPFYYVLKRHREGTRMRSRTQTQTQGAAQQINRISVAADPICERAETIAAAIRSALTRKHEDVRSCIELLISERERVQNEVQRAIALAAAAEAEAEAEVTEGKSSVAHAQTEHDQQLSVAVAGISYTLTKRSIYREILFLLMADLGARRIDLDAYDAKYTAAFNDLKNADKNRLLPNDAPPVTINRLFRRAFSPKPLELF